MASLIILGKEKGSADRVASYIIDYQKLVETIKRNGATDNSVQLLMNDEPIDYEISNKYYSAVVRLCIATSVDKIASQDRELLNGIILVVLSDEKILESPLTRDPLIIDQDSEAVKLLVSFKRMNGPELTVNERDSRFVWALDHSFEFIEIDDADLMQSWNEREKDGLPRVIEALHTHHWHTSEPALSASGNQTSAANTLQSSAVSVNEVGASNEQGPPTLPSVEPISKSESLISSSVTSSALPASNIPANVVDHLKALSPNQTIDGDDEDDDLDKLDELDAQFSNMVAQARSMRVDAANGGLTDDQRRERAAEMAMRLCKLIGLDEGSDSDEEKS